MPRDQQPAFRVFTVVQREGQDDFWLPIGAAFPHQDGKGYNVILQALPIGSKIVLRQPQPDEDSGWEAERSQRRDDRRRKAR